MASLTFRHECLLCAMFHQNGTASELEASVGEAAVVLRLVETVGRHNMTLQDEAQHQRMRTD